MAERRLLLPPSLAVLAREQDGVLTAAQLREGGVSADRCSTATRRGDWRPLLRGTHLVEPRDGLPLARSWARSAALALPEATVGLASAALLHGVQGVPHPQGVQVVVAPGAERLGENGRRGLEPHVWPLAPEEVLVRRGVRLTAPARTLADLLLRVDDLVGLAVLDSAVHRGVLRADELDAVRALTAGRPGCRALEGLWPLVDGRAESPLESRVRLRAVRGGLAPDELQWRLLDDDGRVVARSDLAFLQRRRPGRGPLLVEADGVEPHSAPEALFADRHRQNALTTARCDVLRFTWRDTLSRLHVPTVIAAAL